MAFNVFATATTSIPLANLDANFTLLGSAAAASTLYPTATTSITYGTTGTTHYFSGSGLSVTGTLSATGAGTIGARLQVTAAGSPPASGSGLEVLGGATPLLFAYNRTGSAYLPLNFDASAHGFSVAGASIATFSSTGLAVTGTLSATTTGQVGTTLGVGAATPSASGAGITFPATQSASSDANTLDDYEEGTWTPTDASGAGLSITNGGCTYTKVGRQVSLVASITYPVTANGSNAQIGGFPFSSGATPIPCNIGYATVALALMSYMNGSGTSASFFTPGVNVTNATMSAAVVFFTATYFV